MAEFLLTASAVARIREDAEVSVSRKPGYDEEMDEETLEEPDLWGEPRRSPWSPQTSPAGPACGRRWSWPLWFRWPGCFWRCSAPSRRRRGEERGHLEAGRRVARAGLKTPPNRRREDARGARMTGGLR